MKHRPAEKAGAKLWRARQSIRRAGATPKQSSRAEPPVTSAAPHNRPATSAVPAGRSPRAIRIAPRAIPSSKDRKSVVQGKSVSVRVDLGGSRIIKKKKRTDQ